MTKTVNTETKVGRTRKVALVAALVAGLSGTFAAVGVTAASSDPGVEPGVAEVESHGPMDVGDPAECERFAEGGMFDRGMLDGGDLDHGEMGDMMGAGSRMGA